MDVFSTLPHRTRILVVASSLFLLTLSLGILVFGTNFITEDSHMLDEANHATHADMLYIHPEKHH